VLVLEFLTLTILVFAQLVIIPLKLYPLVMLLVLMSKEPMMVLVTFVTICVPLVKYFLLVLPVKLP